MRARRHASSSYFGPAVRCVPLCALFAMFAGCGDPCRDLANKYCECAHTPEARGACLDKVASLRDEYGRPDDAATLRTCESLLDGCTCEAVASGDLHACGLSEQVTPPQ